MDERQLQYLKNTRAENSFIFSICNYGHIDTMVQHEAASYIAEYVS